MCAKCLKTDFPRRFRLYPCNKVRVISEIIGCECLQIAMKSDRITPSAKIEAAAKTAQQVEFQVLEGGHFEIYIEPALNKAIAIESEFLIKHLIQ